MFAVIWPANRFVTAWATFAFVDDVSVRDRNPKLCRATTKRRTSQPLTPFL
jgi:hypothetical protein